MKVNSRFQRNNTILPFVIGLAIVVSTYLIWQFYYIEEKGDLPENVMINLFLILLVVEGLIAIVEIVLVYRARVV